MNIFNNIVLLKDSNNFIIHYEKYPIDENILDIYIDMYKDKNLEYIYHWNNVNSCVRLYESIGIDHVLIGGGRCNCCIPNDLEFKDQLENGYFDLSNGALDSDIRLKTDNKYFTKYYYIKHISEVINNTPNLYD